jgi:hypothetical protein
MRWKANAGKKSGALGVVTAIAAFALASPAAADMLKYDGAWFAPYSGSFTITDSSPYRAPVAVRAGAFEMIDTSGPTLAPGTSFMAWCVDIYHFISPSTSYTRMDGASFYGSAPYKATDLERLASYVFDNSLLRDSYSSAAFQLAAWEIVNEQAGTGFYDVNGNDFKVTYGDTGVRDTANDWLDVVNAGTYAIDQRLSVWRQDIPGSTQDLAVFAPIPEPGTYAMLLAGLGLMGFVARRRVKRMTS